MRLGLGFGLGFGGHQGVSESVPTRYMFIDAASLQARLKAFSERYSSGAPLQLRWEAVGAGHEKVFYYDALPGQRRTEPDEEFAVRWAEAERLQVYLQTLDRYRVYQGDARWRSGRGHEQKKVDVMITVDMLKHTIRRNMDQATLLASDVDFRPLLDALVDEGMFVTLMYNPWNTSQELLGAADARIALSPGKIWSWLDQKSRSLVGFLSESGHADRRKGHLLDSWQDPVVGLVELRRKNPDEGGWSDASFYCQWQEPGQTLWTEVAAANEQLTRLLAEEHTRFTKTV